MSKPILSTQKTNTRYLMGQLLTDIIYVVIGVYCMKQVEPLRSYWRFDAAETMQTVAILCFVLAFLSVVYHVMVSSTYANVYDGRIAGKGLQKIAMTSFDLRFDQITDISSSKGFLNIETGACVFLVINTTAGSYKVITSDERAKEVIAYFNEAA